MLLYLFSFLRLVGDLAKCQELVDLGAKVDIPDADGFTPVYIAKSRGYEVGMSNLIFSCL